MVSSKKTKEMAGGHVGLREMPWHEKIKQELERRDQKCAQLDPNDVYKRPEKNPYDYGDVEVFKKKYPFNPKRDCKYVPPNGASLLKDPYQRFFKDIRKKKECDLVNGVWTPNAVNRSYRYENGVCWKNKDHAHCSQYESPALLRPNEPVANYDGVVQAASKKCNMDPKCSWVKMKKSQDCFSKEAADKIKKRVTSPPAEMPGNVTSSDGNIEQFLHDFYAQGKVRDPKFQIMRNYKDVLPPATTPLFGEGNRCKPPPPKVPNAAAGREQISEWNAMMRERDARDDEEMGIVRAPKVKRERMVTGDETAADSDETPSMTPSLSQSIINMITKNWAIKEANGERITNRGLLAIHSTGSGKTCTAAGVMDAFWNSKRDIIFASSIDALASNPPSNFQECLYNLYPDFQKEPYGGKTKEESLAKIASAFERRNIRFLSFAKLSNRLKKTLETGVLAKKGGASSNTKRKVVKKIAPSKPNPKPVPKAAKTDRKANNKGAQKETSNKPKKSNDKLNVKTVPLKKQSKAHTKKANEPAKRTVPDKIATEDIIDLNNTILIIDEVHNLFRPLATQKAQHEYLKAHLIDPTKYPGLKMVILSATPGDNVDDIMMLLNMIRDPTHPVIKPPNVEDAESVKKFKVDVRGLISYFDMSGDTTRFPILQDLDPTIVPMKDEQFEKYVEAFKKTLKEKKAVDYDKLAKDNQLYKYWASARKYSNMMFTYDKGMRMAEFGAKLPVLLDTIKAYRNEKHYVYSAFNDNRNKGWSSQGILAIANFMEKELGYVKFTLNDVKFDCSIDKGTGQSDCKIARLPDKRPRYMLVTSKEMGDDGTGQNKSAGERLKKMLKVYNHPENRYGDIVHVMLASNAYNEGIDLKAVRHIHFFEPLVTMASDKQTLGRAARFCSHADLDRQKGEWTVQVHRYMSHYPVNIVVNTRQNTAIVQDVPQKGPTVDEQQKLAALQSTLDEYTKLLDTLSTQMDAYKGVTAKSKNTDARDKKDALKTQIGLVKDDIKKQEAIIKEVKKGIDARDKDVARVEKSLQKQRQKVSRKTIDTTDIKMIDEFIFNESRARAKELLVINQSLKEAAIDCRLLDKFHALSGNKIVCETFPKPEPTSEFKAKDTGVLAAFKKLNPFFFGN